ncbi:unnamed protein product, partial [Rangifer tarandus platyrhynchus]
PVPLPQIRGPAPAGSSGTLRMNGTWCKATLECTASGDTEDLKVTWESKGLPRELGERVAQGRPSNSWTLSASLVLSQPSISLTCVVRKPGGPENCYLRPWRSLCTFTFQRGRAPSEL